MGLRCPAWSCRQRYISDVPQGGPHLQGVLHCLRSGSAATCLVSPVIGGVALLVLLYSWCLFPALSVGRRRCCQPWAPVPMPRLCRRPSFPNVCRGGQHCSAGRGVPRPYDAEGHRWRAGLGREDQVNLFVFGLFLLWRYGPCIAVDGGGPTCYLPSRALRGHSPVKRLPACLPAA